MWGGEVYEGRGGEKRGAKKHKYIKERIEGEIRIRKMQPNKARGKKV